MRVRPIKKKQSINHVKAPRAGLGQSFVNAAQSVEIHLVRAVEDDHVLAQCLAGRRHGNARQSFSYHPSHFRKNFYFVNDFLLIA